MLTQDTIDAFNSRLTIDVNTIKTMAPSELDRVKAHGSTAEALMKNRDLALFVHQYKFELADALSSITGHTQEDNNRRVAISNQLVGLDGFIATLKRAVYMKNRVVTQQTGPAPNNKKVESL
jgi:Fic family protein